MLRATALLGLSLLPFTALAQEEPAETPKVRYAERTEIEFQEFEIDGELISPPIKIVSERRGGVYGTLFHTRTDFNEELNNSINDIR